MSNILKTSNKRTKAVNLFRDRKPKFVNKETLHSIELYNEKLNRKVSIPIISKQHSTNGDIKIFLDATPVNNDYYNSVKKNSEEIEAFECLNNNKIGVIGLAIRNYVFMNTKKINNFQEIFIHELQHSFDFYNDFIPSIPSLKRNLNNCPSEYRAYLASLAFSDIKDVEYIYKKMKNSAIFFENTTLNPFLKIFGFNKNFFNEERFPHGFAKMRIIREIESIKNYQSIDFHFEKYFKLNIPPEEIVEKSKILLDNEYRRLTGRSYDELLDDLINCKKCN